MQSELEKQCIHYKDKYPDKCAIFIETDENVVLEKHKYLVPLNSTFKSFTKILRDKMPEYKLDILINKVSTIDEDRLFSSIFDSYAIRDNKGIEPLYLHVTILAKKLDTDSNISVSSGWNFGFW